MRAVYLTAGIVNVILAVIGTILPIMPTVIFLLLAVWFFTKVDKRFANWIYTRPFFIKTVEYMERVGFGKITQKIKASIEPDLASKQQ
ncbi:MAG: DUF454 family protein [Candidatus Dojkabacteria bacterium]|nr:MAG: DUF454 family protein [Candidatus Dojkabacteria bacterium]